MDTKRTIRGMENTRGKFLKTATNTRQNPVIPENTMPPVSTIFEKILPKRPTTATAGTSTNLPVQTTAAADTSKNLPAQTTAVDETTTSTSTAGTAVTARALKVLLSTNEYPRIETVPAQQPTKQEITDRGEERGRTTKGARRNTVTFVQDELVVRRTEKNAEGALVTTTETRGTLGDR